MGKRRAWVVQRIKSEHVVLRVWTLSLLFPLSSYKYFENSNRVSLMPTAQYLLMIVVSWIFEINVFFCLTSVDCIFWGQWISLLIWVVGRSSSTQLSGRGSHFLSVMSWGPYTGHRSCLPAFFVWWALSSPFMDSVSSSRVLNFSFLILLYLLPDSLLPLLKAHLGKLGFSR